MFGGSSQLFGGSTQLPADGGDLSCSCTSKAKNSP
jgi:hypothetical protein